MAIAHLDQSLVGVMAANGEAILICRWCSENSEFDAHGWLDKFGSRIGQGTAMLPDGGWIDMTKFAVIQPKVDRF